MSKFNVYFSLPSGEYTTPVILANWHILISEGVTLFCSINSSVFINIAVGDLALHSTTIQRNNLPKDTEACFCVGCSLSYRAVSCEP